MNLAEARDAWERGAWVEFTGRDGRVVGVLRGWEASIASYGVALVVAPLGGGPQQACPAELVERWTPRPGDCVRPRGHQPAVVVDWLPELGFKGCVLVEHQRGVVDVPGGRVHVAIDDVEPCQAPASRAVPWGQVAQIASASIRVAVDGGAFGTPPRTFIGTAKATAERGDLVSIQIGEPPPPDDVRRRLVEALDSTRSRHVAALGMTPEEWRHANGEVPRAEKPQPTIAPLPMSDAFARAFGAWIDGSGSFVDAAAAALATGAISPEEMAEINGAAARGSFAAVANRITNVKRVKWEPVPQPASAGPQVWTKPPEAPRDHNATCPRCGKRGYQGIGDIQCVEPVCDDPETRMPDSVARVSGVPGSDRQLNRAALGKRGDARRGVYAEARYRASGRGVTADHPTEEGAVLAWRAAVAAQDGAA